MRRYSGLENWIRKHFVVYWIIRRAAPFICRYIALEDGFNILKYVQPKSDQYVALDVGANDGTSIRMIHKFQKNIKIVAFDPITRPRFSLKNVDFKEFALSDKQERFSLFTPVVRGKKLTQYSSFHKEKLRQQIEHDLGLKNKDYGCIEKSVDSCTLDSLILKPFFVKIDVEGSETAVLKGAMKTLIEFRPVVLIEIQNAETYLEISAILNEIGYKSIDVEPRKNLTSRNVQLNAFYSYQNSHNNYIWVPSQLSLSWRFTEDVSLHSKLN